MPEYTYILNGKPAVKIIAKKIKTTNKAILIEYKGMKEWFFLSAIDYNEDTNTALIQEWLFNLKYPNG